MRDHHRLALTLILLFLATQFISIFGTMCVFASPENYSNYEDMSPEHIVPLDPFLTGGTAHHFVFRSNGGNTQPLKLLELLPFFLSQVALLWFVAPAAVLRGPAARRKFLPYAPNLWLTNRVLLI